MNALSSMFESVYGPLSSMDSVVYECRHCHVNRDSDEPDYGSCEHSWQRFDYDQQEDGVGYEERKAERDRIARLSNAGFCTVCERVWAECECPLPF